MSDIWVLLTDARAPLFVGILSVLALALQGCHVDECRRLAAQRVTSVYLLSAASYVFAVLVYSHLSTSGPPLSFLIEHGVGNTEFSVLLSGALLHYLVRIWSHFVD